MSTLPKDLKARTRERVKTILSHALAILKLTKPDLMLSDLTKVVANMPTDADIDSHSVEAQDVAESLVDSLN